MFSRLIFSTHVVHFCCIIFVLSTVGLTYAAAESFNEIKQPSEQIIERPDLGNLAILPQEIFEQIAEFLPNEDRVRFALALRSKLLLLGLKEQRPLAYFAIEPIIWFRQQKHRSKPIHVIAFSGDGKIIASGSGDGTIKLWASKSGKLISKFDQKAPVNSLAFSPVDCNRFVASGSNDQVKVWDIRIPEPLQIIEREAGSHVCSAQFTCDGKKIVFGCSGLAWCAEVPACKEFPVPKNGYRENLTAKTYRIGKYCGPAFVGRAIKIICLENKVKMLAIDRHIALRLLDLYSNSYSIDSCNYEKATGESSWLICDIPQADYFKEICACIAPNGKRMALCCGRDKSLIDINDGIKEIKQLKCTADVISLAFSSDGRLLAAGSIDKIITLFDLETGVCIKSPVLKSSVSSLAFSPVNKLAIGFSDGSIALWDADK